MAETAIARLFTHGRSQAVRLPKEFRLPGDRARVRHLDDGVLLEPIATDLDAWFAELDRFADVPWPTCPAGLRSKIPTRYAARARRCGQRHQPPRTAPAVRAHTVR